MCMLLRVFHLRAVLLLFLQAMYAGSRDAGLGAEVKRRILMGTYALSAGYYDAVYKRAQQVSFFLHTSMPAFQPVAGCIMVAVAQHFY
jgi:Asp-tRNA(Asn)/Glu-tRNA(Gln) amidotransferase A subunit family amidase